MDNPLFKSYSFNYLSFNDKLLRHTARTTERHQEIVSQQLLVSNGHQQDEEEI